MTTKTPSELRFEPPGPGTWTIDAVHPPRPVTRYWEETHPAAFERGFREFTKFYGLMLDKIDIAYINGFAYHSMLPVADEEVPQRFQRAQEVFEQKLWREQLREWEETHKPASIKAHR